jgi:Putative prokaryotic signal transducing protein
MDLVTVGAFDLIHEAQLAKNLLEAEGIPAFLDEEVASDMLHLTSEVKLQVAAEYADQARAILDAAKRHELTAEAAKEAEASAQAAGEAPAE